MTVLQRLTDMSYEQSFTGGGGRIENAGEYDPRLQHPFGMIVSGPSNSGKSYFVRNLLIAADRLISKKINNIVYIYSIWQPLFDELLKYKDIRFIRGLPERLDDDALLPTTKNNLLIIDDVMDEACDSLEMSKAFTQYVHHRNLSIVYLVQNLFKQGKSARTISLNTNYLVLFKNPRDSSQLAVISRQMYPGETRYFMSAFRDATAQPFGYLLIDFKAKTPDSFRLRSDLFATYQAVYISKKR